MTIPIFPAIPRACALTLAALLAFGASGRPLQAADETDKKAAVATQLAPTGTLRAAINYGNGVLAVKNPKTGALEGVSVDLARELAHRLGIPVKLLPYTAAKSVVDGATKKEWDVAFTAADPARGRDMDFSAPYLLIEGGYMVRQNSPIKTNADVDRDGIRVATSQGSAYDLYLARTLKHAKLIHTSNPATVSDTMMAQSLDVVAGVKQRNMEDAARIPGLRQLDGSFMEIRQTVATPKGRGLAAHYIGGFVEDVKASGFVKQSLQRHDIKDVKVAGPAATQ